MHICQISNLCSFPVMTKNTRYGLISVNYYLSLKNSDTAYSRDNSGSRKSHRTRNAFQSTYNSFSGNISPFYIQTCNCERKQTIIHSLIQQNQTKLRTIINFCKLLISYTIYLSATTK